MVLSPVYFLLHIAVMNIGISQAKGAGFALYMLVRCATVNLSAAWSLAVFSVEVPCSMALCFLLPIAVGYIARFADEESYHSAIYNRASLYIRM
jgi:hypothetical protein